MSTDYNNAKKIIESNEDLVDDFGGASEEIIKNAQIILGVQFPEDYKRFLSCFGALTFGTIEIYGVFREDFENSGIPDAIWTTLKERELVDLPKHLVIIYNTEMGEMYCLNFKELNNNEPRITSYFPGFSEDAQENEVLYNSFGEFLLDMITEEIS